MSANARWYDVALTALAPAIWGSTYLVTSQWLPLGCRADSLRCWVPSSRCWPCCWRGQWIIGAGRLAHAAGRLAIKADHRVMLSNLRGPQNLLGLREAVGCEMGSVGDAAFGKSVYGGIIGPTFAAVPGNQCPELHHCGGLRESSPNLMEHLVGVAWWIDVSM